MVRASVGHTVELRETPYSLDYQAGVETQSVARGKPSGMVKTSRIGQSAAKILSAVRHMEKVQRLSGGGLAIRCWHKIESGPTERWPWEERPNQPGAQGVCNQSTRWPADWTNCTTGITGLWQPSVHSDVAF
jgi:hypothetical protein